jgi:outer membrane protein assembly factor BamD (BamD/ComL family)
MKLILGLFLTILMGLAVMIGYAFQEPRQTESMQSLHRDQTSNLKAFAQEMRTFLQQSPDSEFALTVQQLLKRVEETLASGDFTVAQFYADKANYAGAISRLKAIIDNYPSFSRLDEVNKLYVTLAAKQPSRSPQEKTN